MSADEVIALGLVDPDWAGSELGFGIGTWTDLGPIEWIPADQADETWAARQAEAESNPPPVANDAVPSSRAFIYVDIASEHAYRVEFDNATLDAIATAVEAANEATTDGIGDAPQAPQAAAPFDPGASLTASSKPTQGISGTADRVMVPTTESGKKPLSAIAAKSPIGGTQIVDLATGVMLGSRAVLTAAHALTDAGQGNYVRVYETSAFGFNVARNTPTGQINESEIAVADFTEAAYSAADLKPGSEQQQAAIKAMLEASGRFGQLDADQRAEVAAAWEVFAAAAVE